jgi:hypothetical protein
MTISLLIPVPKEEKLHASRSSRQRPRQFKCMMEIKMQRLLPPLQTWGAAF